MTPTAFIAKWLKSELRERQGSQEHFIDLCRLLGEPTPAEADPSGASYCFERGASKVGGGDGWADVWRRGCFGWEYKGKHKDLNAALRQLQIYAPDLENPPYLVVSDMDRIVVHTNWTNTVRRTLTYSFEDLREQAKLDQLRQIFRGSDSLKPGISPQELTAKVATTFGDLGKRLQERDKHDPRAVAHFLNRLIFCMFAEDAEILPRDLFTKMLRNVSYQQYNIPKKSKAQLDALFAVMKDGGFFGADAIRWFNGGLFDEAQALPLERDDVDMLVKTAKEHDWSNIDPAILGTMFEEALKTTGRRAALGAHYTDREKILKIVEPVIVRPLQAEWATTLALLTAETDAMKAADAERAAVHLAAASELANGNDKAKEAARRKVLAAIAKRRDAAYGRATEIRDAFLAKLAAFRVLDPACGSGNFLYVALHALRDIELRALLDSDRLGVPQVRPRVGLDAVRGIEIEPYAAELARVTLWIGNLQWERRNGYTDPDEPVLAALDTIECRDALLDVDGHEAAWPAADVIVGNPPFLGGKRLRDGLGDDYVEKLFAAYKGRVPAEADFVCYWVAKAWRAVGQTDAGAHPPPHGEKAHSAVSNHEGSSPPDAVDRLVVRDAPNGAPHHEATSTFRAGLVTTNSIRGGANRRVLDPIVAAGALREAWSDEAWVLEGAAVRVSMISFGRHFANTRLNGIAVTSINADLTSGAFASANLMRLRENQNLAFVGVILNGEFEIGAETARKWIGAPLNVNGRSNTDVIRPTLNGDDFNGLRPDKWVVDFGINRSLEEASYYEMPFKRISETVKPFRTRKNPDGTPAVRAIAERDIWWRHARSRPAMRQALARLSHYIATPMVSSYRTFDILNSQILPDQKLIVFASDAKQLLGVLQSKYHYLWTRRTCSWIGAGNDITYSVTATFQTFPLPEGLNSKVLSKESEITGAAQKIASATKKLLGLREAWLNPPDLVRIEQEVVPGYPERILPKDEEAARVLKKRTLTNLYNERPAWLDNAHKALDAAVAAAYGWPADLSDDEILELLFALNQERAAAGR